MRVDADGRLESVAAPELQPQPGRRDVETGDQDALDAGFDGSSEDLVTIGLEGLGLDVGVGIDEPQPGGVQLRQSAPP
jgi:hypothetical protein